MVQFKITSEKNRLPTCWKSFHINGYKVEITTKILVEYDFATYELNIWNSYGSTSFNFSIVPVDDIQKSNKLKMYLVIFITVSSVLFLYIVTTHIWFYRRGKQSSLDGDNQNVSYDEIGTILSQLISIRPLSEQQQRNVRIDVQHDPTADAEDRIDTSDLSPNHSSIHESIDNHQYLSSNDAIQQNLSETGTDTLSLQDIENDQRHMQPLQNQLAKRRYINLQI